MLQAPQWMPLRAGRAVGIDQHLGTTMRCPCCQRARRQAGEHQVPDVGGEVVLINADEDLFAGDAVAAVGLGHGPGAQQAEIVPPVVSGCAPSCRSICRWSRQGRSPSAQASRASRAS